MMEYKGVNSASYEKFHTKIKITQSSLVQKLVLLLRTRSVELEVGVLLQDLPPDVEVPPLCCYYTFFLLRRTTQTPKCRTQQGQPRRCSAG